jgi:hypothetical protein
MTNKPCVFLRRAVLLCFLEARHVVSRGPCGAFLIRATREGRSVPGRLWPRGTLARGPVPGRTGQGAGRGGPGAGAAARTPVVKGAVATDARRLRVQFPRHGRPAGAVDARPRLCGLRHH